MKNSFIKATEEFNDFEKHVPAPYIRKSFTADGECRGKLRIACCGFYKLYFNGKDITRCYLAPYISNPKDIIYYDEYEVDIDAGENVIGIMLGNGFMNNPGGAIWYFDKADFRGAPQVSLSLEYKDGGEDKELKTDGSFKTHESPVRSDDYRFGEYYDANYEIDGWNEKGFDDSGWQNAIETRSPGGELRLCEADPVIEEKILKPVDIIKLDDGCYIYDFGESNAGLCRLHINGKPGQEVSMQHADLLKDGDINLKNVWFKRDNWENEFKIVHRDFYTCKGGEAEYIPFFEYHGFRYVKVWGLTEEQATPDLLTYIVFHSDLKTRGDFKCSNERVNKIQEAARRSDTSCCQWFPNDCPHREKHGWTADAALSCEQMLLNFEPERTYREWFHNIYKAQREDGALPGIVPTAGWGFDWGNGPGWDQVVITIPYYTYIYRGDKEFIGEAADCIARYMEYLPTKRDEKGLCHFGLGDWCHIDTGSPKAPLEVTDSILSKANADKAAFLFEQIGRNEEAAKYRALAEDFKKCIRENLVDFENMTVRGECQTSQSMGIFYNIFNEDEKEAAAKKLIEFVHKEDDKIDFGVLGSRVLFYVLSDYGENDLAYKMIERPDFPSWGNWIERGATTLWEEFHPDCTYSANHHFWGTPSGWFISNIAGIRLNPTKTNVHEVVIKPAFIEDLTFAEGYHISPDGLIKSRWERKDGGVRLTLEIPENMKATLILPDGSEREVKSGEYNA